MANGITDLIPTIYAAMDVVSRELIGFIPNVARDAKAEQAAVNQTVRAHIVPQGALEDITPGMDPANTGDHDIGYVDVKITKSKAYPIKWTGEEQKALSKDGQLSQILVDQWAQGFRTLANAVESDLGALYAKASRAYGTAGTTPFGTANDLTDMAEVNRILDDNGAPAAGRKMIVGSAARAKLEGKHSELFKVNEAGDAGAMLRQRQLRILQGFTMGYSAGVKVHTKGAGTGYLINNGSNEAVGQTTLTLDTGTVNTTGIKAGDVVTIAGDSNKYIVTTGLTAAGGDLVIAKPGLLVEAANDAELTVGNSYTANMAFSQNAIMLAARSPAMPEGGDEADDVIEVMDPVSGLVFQIAKYRRYRQIKYEIGLAWGVQAVKPEHCALLLG